MTSEIYAFELVNPIVMMTKITRIYKKKLRKLYQNAIYHTLRTVLITDCLLMAKFYSENSIWSPSSAFLYTVKSNLQFYILFRYFNWYRFRQPYAAVVLPKHKFLPDWQRRQHDNTIKHTYICSSLITITQLCGKEKIMRDLLSLGCGWRSQYKIVVTLAYPNTKEIWT